MFRGVESKNDALTGHGAATGEAEAFALPDWVVSDYAAIRAHPAYQRALRLHAQLIAGIFEVSADLVRLTSEEALLTIGIVLSALHQSRDPVDPRSGATLTRAQAFATRHGLCSPNRVAALVGLKLHTGYWRQVEVNEDRRIKRLEPTEKGDALSMLFAKSTLGPVQLLSDRFDYIKLLQTDPYFNARYAVEGINLYTQRVSLTLAIPHARFFLSQVAGRQVMLKLWLALLEQEATGSRIVACPYAYLARCFGVSRIHIRRMMEMAQERGLVVIRAPGGQAIELLPAFIELQLELTSLALALIKKAADLAATTTGRGIMRWGLDI